MIKLAFQFKDVTRKNLERLLYAYNLDQIVITLEPASNVILQLLGIPQIIWSLDLDLVDLAQMI